MDGDIDAAVAHNDVEGEPDLTILRNDGAGRFAIAQTLQDPNISLGRTFAAHDLNGDGALDLIGPTLGGFLVLLNDGSGVFEEPIWYATHAKPLGLALFDLEGDGDTDVIGAFSSSAFAPLFALRNITCACPADLDGDGSLDPADFLLYLDLFTTSDPRADVTGDGSIDVNDFFAYLDLFACA